jgi:branched-chain amino acid transport system ATP-binding protein
MILEATGLHTDYGLSRALFGVSLSIARGECVALLGRNGVGKSTTMRSIMGLTPPASGRVLWKGANIAGWRPDRVARAGIGFVPEDRRVFADLTVFENLDVARRASGRHDRPQRWTINTVCALFPKLAQLHERRAGNLSGGEQQMLTIARTLMGNPICLLLDEPSEGLAPVIVEQMAATIRALKREGLTVLLCEQNLHFARAVSDRAVILEKGRVRWQGAMEALMNDEEARRQYLSV